MRSKLASISRLSASLTNACWPCALRWANSRRIWVSSAIARFRHVLKHLVILVAVQRPVRMSHIAAGLHLVFDVGFGGPPPVVPRPDLIRCRLFQHDDMRRDLRDKTGVDWQGLLLSSKRKCPTHPGRAAA